MERVPNVVLDFHADFRIILEKVLVSNGVAVDPNESYDDAVYRYFANFRRRVEARPHQIVEADGLACPPEHAAGYAQLKAELESGVDVTDRLSRKTTNATYEDGMLNDWGVTHFHLGLRGVSADLGTKLVLFALIRDDVALCVGFFEHGGWSKIEVLEIVQRNWPYVMEQARAKGVTSYEWTDEERAKFRATGATILTAVNGNVYGSPGGGYTMARTSAQAHWQADRAIFSVTDYEKYVRENAAAFLKTIEDTGRTVGTPPTFRFHVNEDGRAVATELTAQAQIVIGPFPL